MVVGIPVVCRMAASLRFLCWICLAGFMCAKVEALTSVDWGQSPCQQPAPVANAYRDVSGDYDVTYTCYDGYINVSGDSKRQCLHNGSYSGTAPRCVLKCRPPVLPAELYPRDNVTRTFIGGDSLSGFCMIPIEYGDTSSITCSENLGQWEPWTLFCGKLVPLTNSCWTSQPEVRPYWTGNFPTSHPLELYDVAAVLLVVGDSSKDGVTLTVEVLADVTQQCNDVTPSKHSQLTKVVCQMTRGRRPWGHGVKVTANFSDSLPRQLKLCSVEVHGRLHSDQCQYPPAIPRLKLKTDVTTFFAHDRVLYSCDHQLLPLAGSGESQCSPFGEWGYPSLVCTDEENLAAQRPVGVMTSHGDWSQTPGLQNLTDDDVTTGIATDGYDVTFRVNLGKEVEVGLVTLSTSGFLNFTVRTVSSKTGSSRECEVIEPRGVLTSYDCRHMFVGDAVDVIPESSSTSGECLTEMRVFGHVFDRPLSCIRSPEGADYKGTVNTTTLGRPCLPWADVISAQSFIKANAFPDESVEAAGNFCRNPGGKNKSVMCHFKFLDVAILQEPCDVPLCATHCRLRPDGQDYRGKLNETKDGQACVNWNHPNIRFRRKEIFDWPSSNIAGGDWPSDGDVADGDWRNHNHCRNPGGSLSGPWCHTDAGSLEYGFCDVPLCGNAEVFADSSPSSMPLPTSLPTLLTTPMLTSSVPDDVTASLTNDDMVFSSQILTDLTTSSSYNTYDVIGFTSQSPYYNTFSATAVQLTPSGGLTSEPIDSPETGGSSTDTVTPSIVSREKSSLDMMSVEQRKNRIQPSSVLTIPSDSSDDKNSLKELTATPSATDSQSFMTASVAEVRTAELPSSALPGLDTSFAESTPPTPGKSPPGQGEASLPQQPADPKSLPRQGEASLPQQRADPKRQGGLCPCACAALRKRKADVSDSQSFSSALQSLRSELHLPRDDLSATIRSKTSAPDHRASSVTTGIVGMSLLGLLALLLVAADVISVVSFFHDVINRRLRVNTLP